MDPNANRCPSTPPPTRGNGLLEPLLARLRVRCANALSPDRLRAGRILDFDRDWFSEPSLSNDYYCERGLDRFGWVPEDELCANLYLVSGSRGEAPPALEDIPETG